MRHLALARWFAECAQDLRLALRQFRRAPGVGVVVVLTLALCIGATSAVYAVVQSLLLSPLRYDDGNRIVSLEARRKEDGDIRWQISTELYRLWATRSRTLEDFAADWAYMRPFGADTAVHDSVFTGAVTPSFLPLLRVRPSLGRGFTAADAQRGSPPVALLGDSLWRARFGRDSHVVGRQVVVDGVSRTIIGVVPPGVNVPVQAGSPTEAFGVLIPLTIDRAFGVDAFARLRPGVTSTGASRELDAIFRTLPDTGDLRGRRGEVRTPQDRVDPGRRHGIRRRPRGSWPVRNHRARGGAADARDRDQNRVRRRSGCIDPGDPDAECAARCRGLRDRTRDGVCCRFGADEDRLRRERY